MSYQSSDTSTASPPVENRIESENVTKSTAPTRWQQGLLWALLSPIFLGTIPILAKLAYATGADVLTVVVARTIFAASILWIAMLLFQPQFIKSSKPAIISSLIAGGINGIGSIFFYASLTRINASLGQLINITYLIFVTVLLRFAGQSISLMTLFRTLLAISGVYLLTIGGLTAPDWIGVSMMAFAALTFAVQLVLSQRIMYDIPAQTMTLYAMTAMAIVVVIPWAIFPTNPAEVSFASWRAILLMGLATALSRLTLFLGVKHLGSLQAALLNILEVVVSIVLAIMLLGEQLTLVQWGGAIVIIVSVLLVRFETGIPSFVDWWKLYIQRKTRR